jgi:hypothetical protein
LAEMSHIQLFGLSWKKLRLLASTPKDLEGKFLCQDLLTSRAEHLPLPERDMQSPGASVHRRTLLGSGTFSKTRTFRGNRVEVE